MTAAVAIPARIPYRRSQRLHAAPRTYVLPRWAAWMATGPVVGALTALAFTPTLFALGSLVQWGGGGYRITEMPAVIALAAALGFLGGAVMGALGAVGVAVLDRVDPERTNARGDALLAASIGATVSALFAILVLTDVGAERAWDVVFWLAPIPVSAVVAAVTACLLWKATRRAR